MGHKKAIFGVPAANWHKLVISDIYEEVKFLLHVVQTYKHVHVVLYEQRREKTGFLHLCENKDADQLRGNREADQRLFCYIDSTIPLLPKSEISSL